MNKKDSQLQKSYLEVITTKPAQELEDFDEESYDDEQESEDPSEFMASKHSDSSEVSDNLAA